MVGTHENHIRSDRVGYPKSYRSVRSSPQRVTHFFGNHADTLCICGLEHWHDVCIHICFLETETLSQVGHYIQLRRCTRLRLDVSRWGGFKTKMELPTMIPGSDKRPWKS
jgi:hypothetical protein